jgi:hypothetical protein
MQPMLSQLSRKPTAVIGTQSRDLNVVNKRKENNKEEKSLM